MTTTHPLSEVEAYLAEVRDRLADLPDEERAELLDDVSGHLHEVATEHGAEHLRDRLGAPQQFADELRASAGYGAAGSSRVAISRRLERVKRLSQVLPGDRIAPVWARLEPAWWLVRGVLVAYVVLTGVGSTRRTLVPSVGGAHLFGLIVMIGAAVVSYALGDARPADQTTRIRRVRIAAEVALVVFGLFYLAQSAHEQVRYVSYDSGTAGQDACLRDSAGRAIGNLYAFDATGKLIPQVFLTDQAGRPIDNLCPDEVGAGANGLPAKTTYAHDVNGAPVYNVFPRAQQRATGIDPQTGEATATEPVPAPAVVLPQLGPANSQPAETTTTVVATQP